ncbi:hypothetical protein BC830DRAFT_490256 [Chytriomyces sp. MP71]|nr:hypothetical protein BC830DRAFT_490256 [Chytriomyces sp. MP71]
MLDFKVFFPDHHRVLLLDRTPEPTKFLSVVQSVTPTAVGSSRELLNESLVFKAAVIGLSRDALVAEIVLERGQEWRFRLRRKALRLFSDSLKTSILHGRLFVTNSHKHPNSRMRLFDELDESPDFYSDRKALLRRPSWPIGRPRVTLVLREANTPRQIINENEVIQTLKNLPITLSIHRFGSLSLVEQVRIVHKTDIFITTHGAAMTHLIFLKPAAHVIELFPFVFKKVIYQNFAAVLGVRYLQWQNMRQSRAKFYWNELEMTKSTNMSKERIQSLPIDWYNMDSKNYWRNQDTIVSVFELRHVVETAVKNRVNNGKTKFLIFMPWEQFNNQIVGFKSACAVAKMLHRTLVVSYMKLNTCLF